MDRIEKCKELFKKIKKEAVGFPNAYQRGRLNAAKEFMEILKGERNDTKTT